MKKVLLAIFSFLFIGTALTGSAFILAGCDQSYTQEENKENNGNNENTGENEDTGEDNNNPAAGEDSENNNGDEEVSGQSNMTTNVSIYTMNTSGDYVNSAAGGKVVIFVMDVNDSGDYYADTTVTSASGSVRNPYDWSGWNDPWVKSWYGGVKSATANTGFSYSSCSTTNGDTKKTGSLTNGNTNTTFSTLGYVQKDCGSWDTVSTSFRVNFSRRKYTLTYNANGGSVSTSTKSLYYQQAYGTLPTPTWSGHTFVGWFTTSSGTGGTQVTSSTTMGAGATTIYARWNQTINIKAYYTANYSTFTNGNAGGTVTVNYFNSNGNSATASSVYDINLTVRTYTSITLNYNINSGYAFRGWYSTTPTASNSPVNTSSTYIGSVSSSSFTRSALFVDMMDINIYNRYTISYDTISSGATGGTISVSYTNSSNGISTGSVTGSSGTFTTVAIKSNGVTVTASAKSGYQFVGWYSASPSTSNESTYRLSTATSYTFTASSRSSIYALFAQTYTLTVNYSSGHYTHSTTITVANSTIGLNQTASVGNSYTFTTYCRPSSQPITISRVNTSYTYYMGNGSATTSSSTNSFTYNWSTTANSTINVYVRERYSITYNGNGNTGGTVPGVTYKAHGLNVTLSNNTFQKTGYTASGWNTNTAGTGTNYANGATYFGNTNLTLYAKWVANTYVVNFDTANEILYPYSKSQAGTQGTYTTKIENNVLIYEYKVTTAGLYGPHAGGVDLTVGQQYKWSVDIKCSRARTINSVGHEMGGKKSINVTTSWQTFTYTFTATTNDNGYHAFVFYDYNTQWQVGDVLSYKNLSVQKVSGMKADNAIGSLTVTYDGTYASLPTPTKTGYTFAGWYLDSGLTKPVTTSTKVTTASNHTLYSKWTVNTYQVDVNTYLENTHVVNLDSIQFDVKVNGSVSATNVHDFNKYLNYGSSVEIYNIRVNSGYSYQKYVISVSGIESSGSSKTNIKFTVPAQKTTIGLYVVPNVYTITLNDDIGFLKNMSNWTRYANADAIKATYDKATDTNNFNIVTGGGWEVYGFQMAVTKNTNYTITFDYTVPTYDQHQTYEGYMFQVLNSTPSGNDNLSKDLATYYLPRTASSGKATVTFNSSSYSTVYIILNGGAMADGQNLTFTFKNFKMTGTRQIYMKYGVGWYSNSSATTSITSIPEIPTNLGYSFGGYYTEQGGKWASNS